jgi:type I restriction enzyme S subunit
MCITIAANIAETALLTFPACFPDSVIGFIGDETKCDVRFVEYMFRQLRRHIQHEMRDSGTVQDNINLAYLEHLWFPVPDVTLQREIAETLSAIDDKIHLNSELNRALEALGAALFKSWFVDFDPVVAKREGRATTGVPAEAIDLFPSRFEDFELDPVPQGWRIVPLDSVADFLNGLALQRYPPRDTDDLPVIKIAELRAGSSVGADRCGGVPSEYIIDDGDIVFSWSGSLMVDIWCGGKGALNQHLFKVTSRDVPKWFYLAWLNEHLPEFQAIAADKATTMGHIRRFHLTEAEVLLPPEPLMKAMTTVQQPLLDQIIHNRLESRALAELRDTLLGPLLSGELTVKPVENSVGAAL